MPPALWPAPAKDHLLPSRLAGRCLASVIGCMPKPAGPILVVDDDTNSRAFLARLLQSEGYVVAEAGDGEEALALAREWRPCVILLDLMMPIMDGFSFLEAQSRSPEIADIPVIVISAIADRAQVARRLGPIQSATKPIDFNVLLGQVAHCCDCRK